MLSMIALFHVIITFNVQPMSLLFSRASLILRGVTQPVRMPCVCVCVCVCVCQSVCLSVCGNFFPTNPYLQAGLTDLDQIWHDGRS